MLKLLFATTAVLGLTIYGAAAQGNPMVSACIADAHGRIPTGTQVIDTSAVFSHTVPGEYGNYQFYNVMIQASAAARQFTYKFLCRAIVSSFGNSVEIMKREIINGSSAPATASPPTAAGSQPATSPPVTPSYEGPPPLPSQDFTNYFADLRRTITDSGQACEKVINHSNNTLVRTIVCESGGAQTVYKIPLVRR